MNTQHFFALTWGNREAFDAFSLRALQDGAEESGSGTIAVRRIDDKCVEVVASIAGSGEDTPSLAVIQFINDEPKLVSVLPDPLDADMRWERACEIVNIALQLHEASVH